MNGGLPPHELFVVGSNLLHVNILYSDMDGLGAILFLFMLYLFVISKIAVAPMQDLKSDSISMQPSCNVV